MDREAGDEGLGGGVVWRVGEPWRPAGQSIVGCLWPHSSSFPILGKEASLLPATEATAWTKHEALMADFCPVDTLGFHLVADGPLPRSET